MTVTKVVTVVKTKKGPHTHKKKGELMENDQDAMEVSFYLCCSCLFLCFKPWLVFCLRWRSHLNCVSVVINGDTDDEI